MYCIFVVLKMYKIAFVHHLLIVNYGGVNPMHVHEG